MADTFEVQVEALTGIAIASNSSNPTQSELTQFLTDGAKDVINRLSKVASDKMALFSTSATDSDNSGVAIDSGFPLSVVRADGTAAANLYPATKISSALRYKATNVDSLHYRSNYNPGYYILDGKLYIVPAPSNATTNKGVVSYVTYPTVAFGDTSIGTSYSSVTVSSTTKADPCVLTATSHGFVVGDTISLSNFTEMTELNGLITQVATTPDVNSFTLEGIDSTNYGAVETTGGFAETVSYGFPDEYEYLVSKYAAMRALQNSMAGLHSDTDISTAFTATNTELDETQAVIDSINTNVDSAVTELAEAVTLVDVDIDTAVGAITTALGRVNSAVGEGSDEFDKVAIEVKLANDTYDAEDVELAQGYLQTAQGYSNAGSNFIKEAQTALGEAQGFVGEVTARTQQVSTQVAVAQGYIAAAQGFATEVQTKVAVSNGYLAEVQSRLANLGQEYQWYDKRYQELKAEYDQAFAFGSQQQAQQPSGGKR